jgi:hypothetical protein
MRALILCALAATHPAGCGECQSECRDSVVVNAHLQVQAASLAMTTIVFCRNRECSNPTPLVNNAAINTGGLCASVSILDEVSTTTIAVTPDLYSHDCTMPVLTDGDMYTVTITDANAAIVAQLSATATYHSAASCGTECQSAIIQLEPI